MTPQITVKAYKCNRCGHRWVPRKSTTDSKYVPRTCASCKSPLWDSKRQREYYMQKGKKHWRNVASVIALAGFLALVLTMAPTVSYAATKATETGGGSSSTSDKGTSDTGSSHDSGSDGGSTTDNPSHSNDNSKTVDDGFTSKDGPQPPFAIGKDGRPVKDGAGGLGSTIPHCIRNPNTNSCNPENCSHIAAMCRIPFPIDDRRHHHDHDHDVRIIQKTVIVHDRNNTPQTIIIRQNPTSGACLVTAQQIADTPDIVRQLLDQCNTVTIVSSGGVGVTHSGGASTATATARAG